ncbi:hypothetical protein [uncultured Pseudoalteromonas sp.]
MQCTSAQRTNYHGGGNFFNLPSLTFYLANPQTQKSRCILQYSGF